MVARVTPYLGRRECSGLAIPRDLYGPDPLEVLWGPAWQLRDIRRKWVFRNLRHNVTHRPPPKMPPRPYPTASRTRHTNPSRAPRNTPVDWPPQRASASPHAPGPAA